MKSEINMEFKNLIVAVQYQEGDETNIYQVALTKVQAESLYEDLQNYFANGRLKLIDKKIESFDLVELDENK